MLHAHLNGAANHFAQFPALQLAQRTALDDAHHVARLRAFLLVVGVELLTLGHNPLVDRDAARAV